MESIFIEQCTATLERLENVGSILFLILTIVQIFTLLKKVVKTIARLFGDDSIKDTTIFGIIGGILIYTLEVTKTLWFFLYPFYSGQIAEGAFSPDENTEQQAPEVPSSESERSPRNRSKSRRRSREHTGGIVIRRLRSGKVYGVALGPAGLPKKKKDTQVAAVGTDANSRDSRVNAPPYSENLHSDWKPQRNNDSPNNDMPKSEGKALDEVLKYGRPRAVLRNPLKIRSLGYRSQP